jgi:hypothetical protein
MDRLHKSQWIIILGWILFFKGTVLFGQSVAINVTGQAPDTSAMMDIASSAKGLLIPRLSLQERNQIVLPAKALMIFNITANRFEVNTGTPEFPDWMAIATISTSVLQEETWVNGGNQIIKKPGVIGVKNYASVHFLASNKVFLAYDSATDRVGIHTTNPRAALDINATDALVLPSGNNAQRPIVPVPGMIRFNKESGKLEGYTNEGWKNLQ